MFDKLETYLRDLIGSHGAGDQTRDAIVVNFEHHTWNSPDCLNFCVLCLAGYIWGWTVNSKSVQQGNKR